MFFENSYESELELENSILNKIIETFQNFTQSNSKYENELKLIMLEIDKVKAKLQIPKNNDHYIDCLWSTLNCESGPDSCRCYFRTWNPTYFTKKIVNIMGIAYILWSLEQNQ